MKPDRDPNDPAVKAADEAAAKARAEADRLEKQANLERKVRQFSEGGKRQSMGNKVRRLDSRVISVERMLALLLASRYGRWKERRASRKVLRLIARGKR